MNDPILLRKKLREVLALAPRRRFSAPMLLDALNRLVPETVTVPELQKAIEWNHAKNLIEFVRNHDEERDEWFLTSEGKTKEGIA